MAEETGIAWCAPGPMRHCPRCHEPTIKEARRRVFCASLADWLDNEVPIEWLVDLLDLVRRTPHLDWLLLTKRIGNWRKRVADAHTYSAWSDDPAAFREWVGAWLRGTRPPNVWLGATVVDQAEADRDIPKLLATPAAVRFLSIEPMLGPINIADIRDPDGGVCIKPLAGIRWLMGTGTRCGSYPVESPRVHWVIAGGESGHHARPADPAWFRSLRDQCAAAGVPFFMKQMGGAQDKRDGIEDLPADLRVRQFPMDALAATPKDSHA